MRAFPKTAHLETDRRQIESASRYEIDEHGFVYHGETRLRLQNRSGRWFAQVYRDDGTRWSFDSERMASEMFKGPEAQLTREDILDTIGARIIPQFPRYAITPYGAIYCIEPPKRGPNAGKYYLLQESLRRDNSYVTVTRKDGVRQPMKVTDLIQAVWVH